MPVSFKNQFFPDFFVFPKAILNGLLIRPKENRSKNWFFKPNGNWKLTHQKKIWHHKRDSKNVDKKAKNEAQKGIKTIIEIAQNVFRSSQDIDPNEK